MLRSVLITSDHTKLWEKINVEKSHFCTPFGVKRGHCQGLQNLRERERERGRKKSNRTPTVSMIGVNCSVAIFFRLPDWKALWDVDPFKAWVVLPDWTPRLANGFISSVNQSVRRLNADVTGIDRKPAVDENRHGITIGRVSVFRTTRDSSIPRFPNGPHQVDKLAVSSPALIWIRSVAPAC